jgi:hypothetical protein
MFTLSINDNVAEGLQTVGRALAGGLQPRKINAAVGRAASEKTRAHIYALANTRHRSTSGTNFYEDAADSVSYRDVGNGVEIDIDKAGMAQRFYGGTIEAVNTSHLWIPIPGSKAEGRAPGEFRGQLYPIISALTQKGVALDRETGEPLFALVKSVTQSADPSVLPTEQEYADAALDALDLLVDRVRDQTPEIS